MASSRSDKLNESSLLHKLIEDIEDHNSFIKQQNTVISNINIIKEFSEVVTQLRNFERITDEITARQPTIVATLNTGDELINNNHYASDYIKEQCTNLKNDWHDLEYKLSLTKQQLDDTKNIYTVKSDCQNLANTVDSHSEKILKLDFADPDLASKITKFNNLKIRFNQIGDEVNNISEKKLPKLKVSVQKCDSEIANAELLRLCRAIDGFNEAAESKKSDLKDTENLSLDLANCRALQEWCDEKRVVLEQLQIPDHLDQVDLVKRRVEAWEREIEQYTPNVEQLRDLPEKYSFHSQPQQNTIISNNVDAVLKSWDELVSSVADLKDKLASKQSTLEFALNCDEIINSCEEKLRLASTIFDSKDGHGTSLDTNNLDIDSVMNVQKKLASLERDRDALVQRVKELEENAKSLAENHPERANEIVKKVGGMKSALDQLNEGIKDRQAGLGAAGALFSFIHELDDLEEWVKQSLQAIEDADEPTTLSHVVELQNIHDSLKAEIDSYELSIGRLCKSGKELVNGRPDEAVICSRLDALESDFNNLKEKANDRSTYLVNSAVELKFNAEAKQIETILDNKNTTMKNKLSALPEYVQESEQAVRNQEALVSALDGTRIRCEVLETDADIANIPNQHIMQDRAKDVSKNFSETKEFADGCLAILKSNVKFAKFNVDCAYFADWLTERKALLKTHDDMTEAGSTFGDNNGAGSGAGSANDGMEIHIAVQKHYAFMQELNFNHDKLKKLINDGEDLKKSIPEKEDAIEAKIKSLQDAWTKLTKDCEDREKKLFEYRKAELLDKNIADLDNFANGINIKLDPSKSLSNDDLGDLATVNRLLKEHDLDKTALDFRKQELDATEARLAKDLTGDEMAEMQAKVDALRKKFNELDGPMSEKYQKLMDAKLYHQLKRDLTEEIRWVDEKMVSANSDNFGESLHAVQVLQAKHDTVSKECKEHEPTILELLARSVPNKTVEEQDILKSKWEDLLAALQNRENRLKLSSEAQQYLFDAEEAKDWILDREQMIADQAQHNLEDEHAASRMIRKHNQHRAAITDYNQKIASLADICNKIDDNNNPDKETCSAKQRQLEDSFSSLQALADDRNDTLGKLCEKLKLKQELEEFNNWLNDKQRIAENTDTGKDTHHCQRLLDRFEKWADETTNVGEDNFRVCSTSADNVKRDQPDDSDEISNWVEIAKDNLGSLNNAIDARLDLLKTAYHRNKCLDDCIDMTNQLKTKKSQLPKEIGDDAERTRQLLKKHDGHNTEARVLLDQARVIDNNAADMSHSHSGDVLASVNLHRQNLKEAADDLEAYLIERRSILSQVASTHDFNNIASDLLEWIEETNKKIDSQQRPSDKAQVNSLLTEHANIKNDMEMREPEFEQVYKDVAEIERNLDQTKVNHSSWEKIAQTITELKDGFSQLENKWKNRNTYLLLAAEITGFWADCAHADIWLKSAEANEENNNPVDAKKALKELEQFESNIVAPWNKKFELLKKLTEYEKQEEERLNLERAQQTQENRAYEEAQRQREMVPNNNLAHQESLRSTISVEPEIRETTTAPTSSTSEKETTAESTPRHQVDETGDHGYSHNNVQQRVTQQPVAEQLKEVLDNSKNSRYRSDPLFTDSYPSTQDPEIQSGTQNTNQKTEPADESYNGNIHRKAERDLGGKKSNNSQSYHILRDQSYDTNYTSEPCSITEDASNTLMNSDEHSDDEAEERQNQLVASLAEKAQTPKEMFMINRKFVRGPKGGKQMTRSWNQLHCILSNRRLLFFKDQTTAAKAAQSGGGVYSGRMTYKGEAPLDLKGCQCDVANDYLRGVGIFDLKAILHLLKLSNGAEYLMQAANAQDMHTWVEKLKRLSEQDNSSQADTINSTTNSGGEGGKKRSLFRKK